MTLTRSLQLEKRALAAGIPSELARSMAQVARDAEDHEWVRPLQEWALDEAGMLVRALEEPQKMAEACALLLTTDGLLLEADDGQPGPADPKRYEIEDYIFNWQ